MPNSVLVADDGTVNKTKIQCIRSLNSSEEGQAREETHDKHEANK